MSNPRKKIKITPTDFLLKEWWSDLKIISSDGMELYVSKYQLAANSPFFNRIFTEDPECKELKINYNTLDICRWLKAFHKLKCKIPECNIGTFIMLCNQYEMKELEEIGLKYIDKVVAKSNIDVIEYASKTTIFDSKINIISQWLTDNKFTKKELTNIDKEFILKCFTKYAHVAKISIKTCKKCIVQNNDFSTINSFNLNHEKHCRKCNNTIFRHY